MKPRSLSHRASRFMAIALLFAGLTGVAPAQSSTTGKAPEVTQAEKERRRLAARQAAKQASSNRQRDPSRSISYPSNL